MKSGSRPVSETSFVKIVAALTAAAITLPTLYGWLVAPPGSGFLGFPINTDDHMVYAAWMRQAMDFRLLMDNRFAVESQPGLTIHLFFFFTGLLAKIVGIPLAAHAARIVFAVLFVFLADRLIVRAVEGTFARKLSLILTLVGGGLGFLAWHQFGVAFVRPGTERLQALIGGLPIDVWQPEAFIFPSLLTSGLFAVSLCLILYTFLCVLDARESAKPVLPGAIAFGLLMNIHSYDALLVFLVLLAFLAMRWKSGDASRAWILRALGIGAGALLPALWFLYVLRSDPVFQARAATETFSPNFRQVIVGILPLAGLAVAGWFISGKDRPERTYGAIGFLVVCAALWGAATSAGTGYFLQPLPFVAVFGAVTAAAVFLRTDRPALDLVTAWAVVGTLAPYFPALFQRKLAMGLSMPWAILAALGAAALLAGRERNLRNLVCSLLVTLLGASSLLWVFRVKRLTDLNVSSTTVHPVYLSRDVVEILAILNREPGRKVVLAMPGVPNPDRDSQGAPIMDSFSEPLLPDWNPFLAGLAGAYAYAGHWSETPDYLRRRNNATKVFLANTSEEERRAILASVQPDFLVAPVAETYGNEVASGWSRYGTVVHDGSQFQLIRVAKEQL